MLALRTIFGVVLAVAFLGGTTHGSIVFDNGLPDQGDGGSLTTFVGADDFVLGAPTTITDAHFWSVEDDPWDGTLQWFIFEDDGGQPVAAPLATGDGIAVSKVATGNVIAGFLDEFAYDFRLDTPVLLGAGTTYWFGLHLSSSFDFAFIGWESTDSGFGFPSAFSEGGTFDNWESGGPTLPHLAFYLTDDRATGAVSEFSSLVTWGCITFAVGSVVSFQQRRSNRIR
jgi:hypothetical protein